MYRKLDEFQYVRDYDFKSFKLKINKKKAIIKIQKLNTTTSN